MTDGVPMNDRDVPVNVPPPEGEFRILLVDDHVESVVSVGRLLRAQGFQVQAALSGPEAVSSAAAFRPDVALIDLSLPVLDGFAVAQELRAMPATKGMFLIALTGWDSDDVVARARAAGFDRHIVKPLSLDAMLAVLAVARRATAHLE
jgi:two-component system, sensor histidine kinase